MAPASNQSDIGTRHDMWQSIAGDVPVCIAFGHLHNHPQTATPQLSVSDGLRRTAPSYLAAIGGEAAATGAWQQGNRPFAKH